MESITCPKCGYTWTPRKAHPIRCPLCMGNLMSKEEIIKLRQKKEEKEGEK